MRPLRGGGARAVRGALRLPAVRGLRQLTAHSVPQVCHTLPHAGAVVFLSGWLPGPGASDGSRLLPDLPQRSLSLSCCRGTLFLSLQAGMLFLSLQVLPQPKH